MKDFDYASLIFHRENASIYPAEYAQNAYYGFFLLARSVGNLLAKSAPEAKGETSQETRLSELALSYLESDYQSEHKNTFLRTKPYSYQLVCALRDFLELQISADPETDYVPFIDQINLLIKHIEVTRTSENLLRSLDIQIAKRWCRILRIYCFLRIPEGNLSKKYSYERDLHICAKRGLNKEKMYWIDFRVRFRRFQKQEKIGKLILLAEEWEMLCTGKEIDGIRMSMN